MTNFTSFNSSIVSPVLKSHGFRVDEDYTYGVRFDYIVYKSGEKKFAVYFKLNKYDYDLVAVKIELSIKGVIVVEKYFNSDIGYLISLLTKIADEIECGAIPI